MAARGKRTRMLILDSRERSSGTVGEFTLQMRPAILDASSVRLLYCSVANPIGNTEPYWMLRIPEFGINSRPADESNASTWVIPISSAQGYRTFHRDESDFGEKALQKPSGAISQLHISLTNYDGTLAGLGGFDWFAVLAVSY